TLWRTSEQSGPRPLPDAPKGAVLKFSYLPACCAEQGLPPMHGPVSEPVPSPAVPLANWREWVGLGVLVLPALLIAIDMTVLHLAVLHLAADMRPTRTELLWIIDIYGFFIAGSLVTMGSLGDRIGRRKLLLIGAAAFSVTSLLAAFATTPTMLIIARAL